MRKRDDKGKFVFLTDEEKIISKLKLQEYRKKYKLLNRERNNELEKIRRKNNPEKFKLNKKNYRNRNPEKDKDYARKNPEIFRLKSKEGREQLTDSYVAGRLAYKTNLTCSEIRKYPELIEARRLIIKTKRLIIKTKRL